MAVAHDPNSSTPDLMADKDGDRVLLLTAGDLALQIGTTRYRLAPGDAVQIPRGTRFGNSHSSAGAQMLLIRSKPARSFTLIR
jgi:quercetin dioxygenase-like cupin family protein